MPNRRESAFLAGRFETLAGRRAWRLFLATGQIGPVASVYVFMVTKAYVEIRDDENGGLQAVEPGGR